MRHRPRRRETGLQITPPPDKERAQDLALVRRVYRHFADTGRRLPAADDAMRAAYARCADRRWLVLDDRGEIEMAIPFSGIPRPHQVIAENGITYWANCAWDTLGIVSALGCSATVRSPCPDCDDPLSFTVDDSPKGDALFHVLVPAHRWWNDIRFT